MCRRSSPPRRARSAGSSRPTRTSDHSPAAAAAEGAHRRAVHGMRARPPRMAGHRASRPTSRSPAASASSCRRQHAARDPHARATPPTTCATCSRRRRLLFTGDHVMQGSTVVINPPDGDMARLPGIAARAARRGPRLARARPRLPDGAAAARRCEAIVAHRLKREAKVVEALRALGAGADGRAAAAGLRRRAAELHPMARRSLTAHLLKLRDDGIADEREGRSRCEEGGGYKGRKSRESGEAASAPRLQPTPSRPSCSIAAESKPQSASASRAVLAALGRAAARAARACAEARRRRRLRSPPTSTNAAARRHVRMRGASEKSSTGAKQASEPSNTAHHSSRVLLGSAREAARSSRPAGAVLLFRQGARSRPRARSSSG